MTTGLKIVFAGTPDFAAAHLQALLRSPHQVVAVYTQPDRPAGRGKKFQASPVKELATQAGLPVEQPASLKQPEAQAALAGYAADIMVVVAYGLLLPKAVLEIPRLGCINVHASLLPRWRGAAPIQRAIEAGDTQTGITIMQMDVGLDTGPMLLIRPCPLLPDDTAQSLHDRLVQLGPSALLESLSQLAEGTASAKTQSDEHATYARKLTKEEAALDWSQSAAVLARRIQAFNPFPVAFTVLGGENLRIYQARAESLVHRARPGTILAAANDVLVACGGDSALHLQVVQLPSKKVMPIKDVLNGFAARFQPGLVMGNP